MNVRLLTLVAWALLLSACSFAAGVESVMNQCGSAADCGDGESCNSELGVCVSEMPPSYAVILRVTTTATAGRPAPPPTRFGPFELDEAVSSRSLEIRGVRNVAGLVAIRDDATEMPVDAELLLTPRRSEPGPGPETSSVMTSAPLEGGSQASNFTASLRADTDYDVEVRPLGSYQQRIPPRTFLVSAEDIESGEVALVYDAPMPLSGVVFTAEGQPLAGAQVRAVHPESELAEPVVVSGQAITDVEGEFEVSVDRSLAAEGDVPWLLQVGPSSELPWLPTWRADPRDMPSAEPGRVALTLPALPPRVPLEVTVESQPEDELILDVGGAQVTFEAELSLRRPDASETPALLSRTGRTDDEGSNRGALTLELLEGAYEVRVIPPADDVGLAPLHASELQVVAQPPGGTQRGITFVLPQRGRLRGVVSDARGRTLPGVEVRSVPLEPSASLPPLAAYARSASAVTGPEGQYGLPLDIGVYDLVFEPPDASAFPWVVRPRQVIESHDTRVRDVSLGAPVVLRGEVQFQGGREPGGALVSAFAALEEDEGTRYVQIGRATVQDDGSYELFLPGELPSGSE